MNKKEVRTEFTDGTERVQVQTEHPGKERRESLVFAWGLRFLLRIVV